MLQGAPQNRDPLVMRRTCSLMRGIKFVFPRSPWQSKNSLFCGVLNALKRSEVQFMRQSLLSPGSIRAENGPLVLGAVSWVCWPSRAIGLPETAWLWGWTSSCRVESGLASFVSRLRGVRLRQRGGRSLALLPRGHWAL